MIVYGSVVEIHRTQALHRSDYRNSLGAGSGVAQSQPLQMPEGTQRLQSLVTETAGVEIQFFQKGKRDEGAQRAVRNVGSVEIQHFQSREPGQCCAGRISYIRV